MFNKTKISFYFLMLLLLLKLDLCSAQKVFVNFNTAIHKHDTRFYNASESEIKRVFESSYKIPKLSYSLSIGMSYKFSVDSFRISNKNYSYFIGAGFQLKHEGNTYPRFSGLSVFSKWMIEYDVKTIEFPVSIGIFPLPSKKFFVGLKIIPSAWWRKQQIVRSQFGGKQIDSFNFYAIEIFPSIGWQINKRFSIELYTRLVNFKSIDKILFDPEIYFPDPTERAEFESKKYEWHNPFLVGVSISYAPFGRKPKEKIIVEAPNIVEEEIPVIKPKKKRRRRKR